MQEFSVPPASPPNTKGNLSDLPVRHRRQRPDGIAFSVHDGDSWAPVTYADFGDQVDAIAKGLMAAGIEAGDRVALMSRTRYEWTLLDFAIWTAGAVSVPIYETSSASQVEWIVSDSGAKALFVETTDHARTVSEVRDTLTSLEHVWQIDANSLDELVAAGAEVSGEALEQRRKLAGPGDLATIIYTSGTTGRPKGCEITHGNFLDLSDSVEVSLPEVVAADGAATLLFLPLAHVLARLIEVVAFAGGVRMGHSPDVKNLLPDLAGFKPTFLLAVPRVFEKIYNGTEQKLAAEGKQRIFAAAAATAISYSRSLDTGGPSAALRLRHRILDLLVYRKLRETMGGKVAWSVSGGAPLGERLGHFFRGIGVTILEGYGLTETTAPTNVGRPGALRIGTVGRPLPGVGIAIADDGEVLVKGIGIFRGYRGNEEATREAFTDDGWFRTGDIGTLDDGYLTITGRKKEIIVTAGGKNVVPAPLEDAIRSHPLVSQCLVVGDGRQFIGALISLDPEMTPAWGKAHDLPDLTAESARTEPVVLDHLQKAIDRANRHVSQAESVRAFTVIDGDFTEENGYLTPSLKLKRNHIAVDFADVIDELYRRKRPTAARTD